MLDNTVFNTSKYFEAYGIRNAVFSPGSRNAPLTISFARNEHIKKWIIPDERAAGFIALGIAQRTNEPVVLCCTSGTALLNYAPAIAEAYYREIPLIVLSADRPPELIDQRDGQTIRQYKALNNHVKASYQLPVVNHEEETGKAYRDMLDTALSSMQALPLGPIHINVPFKEPFYPTIDQDLSFECLSIQHSQEISTTAGTARKIDLVGKKVLIVIGQSKPDQILSEQLSKIEKIIPVLKSPLNNLAIDGVNHIDFFLNDQSSLAPEILITSGLSVLSKKLKEFIRKHKPKNHLHFDPAGVFVDTYQSNPQIVETTLSTFLRSTDMSHVDVSYRESWKTLEHRTLKTIHTFDYPDALSESEACQLVLKSIPEGSELHVSNSMPVRFAELFSTPPNITTWSNRGTSGIDGCTSTALGHALLSEKLNVLVTGELAFLYDRNAFFHNYRLPNLRIIVTNNKGGGIFRLIEGPSRLPELETYFETRHNRTAEYICQENNISYRPISSRAQLEEALRDFFEPGTDARLMEIFTDPELNEQVFKDLKKHIHEYINH